MDIRPEPKRKKRTADYSHYPQKPQGRRSKRKGAKTERRAAIRSAALKRERENRKLQRDRERALAKSLKAQKERRVTVTHTMAKSTLERLQMIPVGKRSKWIENLILREIQSILLRHGKIVQSP